MEGMAVVVCVQVGAALPHSLSCRKPPCVPVGTLSFFRARISKPAGQPSRMRCAPSTKSKPKRLADGKSD